MSTDLTTPGADALRHYLRPKCRSCHEPVKKWTVTDEELTMKFEAECHGYEMVRLVKAEVTGLSFSNSNDDVVETWTEAFA